MNAPAATAAHSVKLAVTVGGRKGALYVVECVCGWSTPLCQSQPDARDQWRGHVDGAARR